MLFTPSYFNMWPFLARRVSSPIPWNEVLPLYQPNPLLYTYREVNVYTYMNLKGVKCGICLTLWTFLLMITSLVRISYRLNQDNLMLCSSSEVFSQFLVFNLEGWYSYCMRYFSPYGVALWLRGSARAVGSRLLDQLRQRLVNPGHLVLTDNQAKYDHLFVDLVWVGYGRVTNTLDLYTYLLVVLPILCYQTDLYQFTRKEAGIYILMGQMGLIWCTRSMLRIPLMVISLLYRNTYGFTGANDILCPPTEVYGPAQVTMREERFSYYRRFTCFYGQVACPIGSVRALGVCFSGQLRLYSTYPVSMVSRGKYFDIRMSWSVRLFEVDGRYLYPWRASEYQVLVFCFFGVESNLGVRIIDQLRLYSVYMVSISRYVDIKLILTEVWLRKYQVHSKESQVRV